MMTPTHWIYKVMALYGIGIFGILFIAEMIKMLKNNHWNVLKTLIGFIKEF